MSEFLGWTVIALLGAVIEMTVRNWRLRCRLKAARRELARCYNMLPGIDCVREEDIPEDILSGTVADSIHASISTLQDKVRDVGEHRDLNWSMLRRTQEELRKLKLSNGGRP